LPKVNKELAQKLLELEKEGQKKKKVQNVLFLGPSPTSYLVFTIVHKFNIFNPLNIIGDYGDI